MATRVSTYRIPVYFFLFYFFQEVLVLAIFYERAYCPAHIPWCLPDLLLYDLVSSIGTFLGDSFTAHYILFLCWYFLSRLEWLLRNPLFSIIHSPKKHIFWEKNTLHRCWHPDSLECILHMTKHNWNELSNDVSLFFLILKYLFLISTVSLHQFQCFLR